MTTTAASAPRRAGIVAAISLGAVAVGLSIAFFPVFYEFWGTGDDEGYLLVSLRSFLDGGDLYETTFTQYGPFYYLFFAPPYFLTGVEPTLDNTRIVVLALTSASASLLGGAVWRVTRNLPWALLGQVGAFLLIVLPNRQAQVHPGALIAFVLSVLVFALAGYASSSDRRALAWAGGAVGALVMIKINVGLFALGGVIFAFVVANPRLSPRLRTFTLIGAVAGPFLLIHRDLTQIWAISLAALIAVSVLALAVSLPGASALPVRPMTWFAAGAVAVALAAMALPLATGTAPGALVHGVVIAPTRLADLMSLPPPLAFGWESIVVTLVGLAALATALGDPGGSANGRIGHSWPPFVLLGLALWLFGSAVAGYGGFGAWLPAVVLLPAFAAVLELRTPIQASLRLLVPVAVFQLLHTYPLAGQPMAWGTVAVVVPCAIAGAAACERIAVWDSATRGVRVLTGGALGFVLMLSMGLWPLANWVEYLDNPSLGLPGAELVRLDPDIPFSGPADDLRGVTEAVRVNCDTFYSTPGVGSFYIFTELDPPRAPFSTAWSALFDDDDQRLVIEALDDATASGSRVCLITDREPWLPLRDEDRNDPLVSYFADFTDEIAVVGRWTVTAAPGTST